MKVVRKLLKQARSPGTVRDLLIPRGPVVCLHTRVFPKSVSESYPHSCAGILHSVRYRGGGRNNNRAE